MEQFHPPLIYILNMWSLLLQIVDIISAAPAWGTIMGIDICMCVPLESSLS